jgi:uncharacterized membrane protein YgdD (TMEM256/DUF423 family)
MNKQIVLVGITFCCIAIILGAFGTHGLQNLITPKRIISFEVGVRYQFYHGLTLLLLGFNSSKLNQSITTISGLIIAGTVCFSGSIYLLALQELIGFMKFLVFITPFGGVLLIIAWILLFIRVARIKI